MFSQQQLSQLLTQTLGEALSPNELQSCLRAVEILEPPVARLFWQSTQASPGIYLVLAGKVRLLDSSRNLIITLTSGESFGEATLFPEEDFSPYVAKASQNLKLCFLNGEVLQPLLQHNQIREHIFARAELWDLLLLCRQNSQMSGTTSAKQMLEALSLFERHNLEIGSVPAKLSQDCKLWVPRRGELLHSDGYRLAPGNIYPSETRGSWQVTQPTIFYCLRNSNWQSALQHYSQLSQLVDSDSKFPIAPEQDILRNQSKPLQKGFTNQSNVISFRQPTSSPKQKQKLLRPYFPNPKIRAGQVWGRFTKRYPFFAQQSASDCGAACLVMLARYWGKRLNLNRLRDLTNVSRSGASLRGLTAAAESIGFTTRPVKASLDKLAQQSLPAIVHWEGKHYIVVYEITPKRVIVGDPAIGQRKLSHAEFKEGWTGYALLLQPTALFKETEEASTPFWQFQGFVIWMANAEVGLNLHLTGDIFKRV